MPISLRDIPSDRIVYNADMKKYTTFHIGGCAQILVFPKSENELESIILQCLDQNICYTIIGNGSNLLVRDGGIEGVVICTKKMDSFFLQGNRLVCECGCLLPKLAHFTAGQGLKGLEYCAQIPATIGGAIYMNAGAYGFCIGERVSKVSVFREGKKQKIDAEQCDFSYRESRFAKNKNEVIFGAEICLQNASKTELADFIAGRKVERDISQPTGVWSAGSAFKGVKQQPAWQLIEKCGLKGLKIGGAEVSKKHANFIINSGGATAKNVLELIDIICKTVQQKCGQTLELEIQIIGKD